MEEVFRSFVCPTCGGPSHPATGCAYSETFVVCRRCTEEVWAWIRAFTNGKGGRRGRSFYSCVNRDSEVLFVAASEDASCV